MGVAHGAAGIHPRSLEVATRQPLWLVFLSPCPTSEALMVAAGAPRRASKDVFWVCAPLNVMILMLKTYLRMGTVFLRVQPCLGTTGKLNMFVCDRWTDRIAGASRATPRYSQTRTSFIRSAG